MYYFFKKYKDKGFLEKGLTLAEGRRATRPAAPVLKVRVGLGTTVRHSSSWYALLLCDCGALLQKGRSRFDARDNFQASEKNS